MKRHFRKKASILLLLTVALFNVYAAAASSPNLRSPPSQVTAITFGSTTAGVIAAPGETDSFTFSAENGDALLIGISQVSGDLWPKIRLYDPDGQLIADEQSSLHAEIYHVIHPPFKQYLPFATNDGIGSPPESTAPGSEQSLIVTTPGQYTILVSDGFNGTYTGSYSLYLQKLNPPVGATSIAFGQTLSGAITYAAEMGAFTFQAVGSERVIISLSNVSGDIWPEVRLYDPDGILLDTQGDPVHSEIEFDVPREGNYTLLIGDGFRGTYTGSYSLFLQRLDQPVGSVPISYGQTLNGSVNFAAEMEAFTLDALGGDRILIGVTNVSGDIWPQIRLYDPDGLPLLTKEGPIHSEIEFNITMDGTYTILIADGFRGTYTGSFNLFIQRLNDPVNATSITFGESKQGAVSLAAEMDAFTFDAVANDQVQITVAKLSGDIWPEIRLYDPSGLLLNQKSGPASSDITQVLPETGRYTILVSDGFRGAYTGSYNLLLN